MELFKVSKYGCRYVWMYVSMYVCMYVCMHSMHVMYVCICLYVYENLPTPGRVERVGAKGYPLPPGRTNLNA